MGPDGGDRGGERDAFGGVAVRSAILLIVLGVLLVAVGAGLMLPAAGVIVAGVECLGAGYVVAYVVRRNETP